VKRPVLDLVSEAKQTKQEKPLSDEDKRFKEVLHQFVGQTLFGQMLKSMRATQEKNPYFDGGRAEEIFQGQLDAVLTDQMTKSTSRSLSDPMYKLMTASKTK
jgi:Rod binding domain-containing protein